MHAAALNCPNCGAAVAHDAPNCPFCSSRLQTVACAACHGMMWLGSKFCPHCGGPAQPVVIGEFSGQDCPRCHVPLLNIRFGKAFGEECSRCRGLWMRPIDFDRACSDAESQAAASGYAPIPRVRPSAEDLYPMCPECAERMSRQNFARRSGIVINACRAHGVWLDGDELRQVIEFIRAGGLDRARQLEKQELRSERRRLESERRDTPSAAAFHGGFAVPDSPADVVGGVFRALFTLLD